MQNTALIKNGLHVVKSLNPLAVFMSIFAEISVIIAMVFDEGISKVTYWKEEKD